jgi:hypothetical protein
MLLDKILGSKFTKEFFISYNCNMLTANLKFINKKSFYFFFICNILY